MTRQTSSQSNLRGAIAQLGERVVRNDEAVGSIPTSSTIFSITCRHPDSRACHTLSHKTEPARLGVASNFAARETLGDSAQEWGQ